MILFLVESIPDRSHRHNNRKVVKFIILLSLKHLEHVFELIVLLFKLDESCLLRGFACRYRLFDGGMLLARVGVFSDEALSKTQLAFHVGFL